MASNQTNRFQSLDSSVEEFIDGQENENTKKKIKHDVALLHEFLVLKGVPNKEKCPVKAYKVYVEKRPAEMKTDDAPFYLAVNNVNLAPANLGSKKLQSV